MKVTILFDGLDPAALARLLLLPHPVRVEAGGGPGSGYKGYSASVELTLTPDEIAHLIEDMAEDKTETTPATEHTAPELDGQPQRVFTFGPDHRHPTTGESLAGRFARIPGDVNSARDRALAIFGRNFATDYDPGRAAQLIAKWDLDEINPRPVYSISPIGQVSSYWNWGKTEVKSTSERRFQIVNELGAVAGLDAVPLADSEDTDAAMAAYQWDEAPTRLIPIIGDAQ
jgi:hypothetical protein